MYDARTRYLADSVATASPAQLLTMLYDRMVLDLDRAADAMEQGDQGRGDLLVGHASDIVTELMATLDTGAWEGGARLMSIYGYVLTELLSVRAGEDGVRRVRQCRALLAPLGEAWHEAAQTLQRQNESAAPGPGVGLLGVA